MALEIIRITECAGIYLGGTNKNRALFLFPLILEVWIFPRSEDMMEEMLV